MNTRMSPLPLPDESPLSIAIQWSPPSSETAGLLLPDLQLVEREQPTGATHFVGVEPELPIDDPFDGAAGAVADEDRDVGEQDRMVVLMGGLRRTGAPRRCCSPARCRCAGAG